MRAGHLTGAPVPGGIGAMPEYDAFGREIGEDTLAGWRTGSGAQPPQPAPAPEQAGAAAGRAPSARRRPR